MIGSSVLERVWPEASGPEPEISTEHRILRCAIEMFGRRGFEGTSTRAIASAAAVTAPLIGYHFGNKEGLFRRCVEVVMGGMTAAVLDACGDGRDLRRSVHELALAHQQFAQRYPEAIRFVLGVVYGPEEAQPKLECMREYRLVWDWAREALDSATERGEFEARPGASTTSLLRHLFHIVLLEVFASFERERFADSIECDWGDLAAPTPDPIIDVVDQFFRGGGEIRESRG